MIISKTNKVEEDLTEHPEIKNEFTNMPPNFKKLKLLHQRQESLKK